MKEHSDSVIVSRNGTSERRKTIGLREITSEEFCNRTQVHGIMDWYLAQSKVSRAFWALAILLALAILVFGTYSCLREFYVNPIVTSVSVVPVDKFRAPVVYICPTNYLNKTNYVERKSLYLAEYFKSAANISEGIIASKKAVVEKLSPVVWSPATQAIEFLDGSQGMIYFQEQLFAVAYVKEEFVKECYHMSQQENCTLIVTQVLDKDHGVCYAVDALKMQTVQGLGLTLLLDLNTELYPKPTTSDGVIIRVDREINPMSYRDIFVAPGTHTKISLSATETRLISVPGFSKTPQVCIEEHPFRVLNISYSREACQFDCFQSITRDHCGCFLAIDLQFLKTSYHNDPREQFCSQTEYHDCVIQIKDNETAMEAHRECSKDCHRACNSWHYDASTSFQKLPSKTLLDYYNDKKSEFETNSRKRRSVGENGTATEAPVEEVIETTTADKEYISIDDEKWEDLPRDAKIDRWADNLIMLDVAFSRMEYTKIEQSPSMTLNTLISNIGGQCGLWLGASIVTIIQLIVYFIRIASNASVRRKAANV